MEYLRKTHSQLEFKDIKELFQKLVLKKVLTIVERRASHESFASWTFQAGVSGGSSVADALQVVMPEGRTPGRHDGRDAEVRRFSPLSLRRHPSSRVRRRHSCSYVFRSLLPGPNPLFPFLRPLS